MKTTLLSALLVTSLFAINAQAVPASAPQPILGEARSSEATQSQPLADSGYFQTKMGQDVADSGYFKTKMGKDVADSGYFQTPQGKTAGIAPTRPDRTA